MKKITLDNLVKASNALDAGFIILEGFEATKKALAPELPRLKF